MGDPLEDFFRQRLHDHEETPPAGAWQRINEDIKPVKEPKRGIFWWMAPLLLLLSVLTAVLVLRFRTPADMQAAGTENTGASTQNSSPDSPLSARSSQAKTGDLTHTEPSSTTPSTNAAAAEQNAATKNLTEAANTKATDAQAQPSANNNNGLNLTKNDVKVTSSLALATGNNRPKPVKATEGNRSEKPTTRNSGTQKPALSSETILGETGKNQAISNQTGKDISDYNQEKPANSKNTGTTNQNSNAGTATGNFVNNAGNGTTPKTTSDETENATIVATNNAETTPSAAIAAPDSALTADSLKPELAVVPDSVTETYTAADSAEPVMPKMRFGFYAGTQFSFRRYAPNQTDQIMINQIQGGSKTAPERFKYVAGGLVQRSLGKRLAAEVGAGILFAKEKLEYETTTLVPTQPSATFTSIGMELQPSQEKNSHKTESQLLYSSARAGLVLTAARTGVANVAVSGGGLLHVLTYQKHTTTLNGQETKTETLEPRKLQTGVYAGLRFSRPFSRSLDVALEPGLTYYFNSWNRQDQPLRIYSHSYNLNLVFFFR